MTTDNLDKMKARLLEVFNDCIATAKADLAIATIPNRTLAAELVQAAAQAAKAITSIERAQYEMSEKSLKIRH